MIGKPEIVPPWKKGKEIAELYMLFEVMSPSEIGKVFPEYKKCISVYYIRWKNAKKSVKRKLSLKPLAKRLLFGTNKKEE